MLKAFLNYNHAAGQVEIWIVDDLPSGRRAVAQPLDLTFVTMDEENGAAVPFRPTLALRDMQAQSFLKSLAEEIKNNGIRTDAGKVEGELEATKKHLEDLREWFGVSLKSVLAQPKVIATSANGFSIE